jgi:hypothetical protein
MKQFMLATNPDSFNEIDKTYSVWLGNRCGLKFYSKRNMAAFVADTNRFLTDQLVELNGYYKQVFCEYRDIWFILYNFKNGKRVNMADVEREIEKCLNDVMDQFSRAGNSYRGASSGGWSFKFLENICYFLLQATDYLINVNKKRNNTINYHNLEVIRRNVNVVATRIMKYPEKEPDGCAGVLRN